MACSPQAWASATLPGLLAAAIGLHFVPQRSEIRFNRPVLPAFLEEVELHGLKVGNCEADVLLRRHAIDVGVTVLRRSGTGQCGDGRADVEGASWFGGVCCWVSWVGSGRRPWRRYRREPRRLPAQRVLRAEWQPI